MITSLPLRSFTSLPLRSFAAFRVLAALLLAASVSASAAETKPVAKGEPTAFAPIRIRAGTTTPHTDETGVAWLPDQGFDGGDMAERQGLAIINTKTPSVYWGEHFGMDNFTRKLPNGRYTVKLHFAITYDAITGPDQVVFSFKVENTEVKDFDVWTKAGGALSAHIETFAVEITDGQLDIGFIPQKENPFVSAIEILAAK